MNRTHFEIKCLRRLKPILRSMYRTSCRRSSSRRRYHGSVAEDAWLDTCQKLLNRWEPHSLSHQAQLREATLQAENADFERAISNCENKIQEKVQEADLLQRKLEQGELEDLRNGHDQSGASVGDEAWEEYGCILWDLHAELLVENLILEVIFANLMVCKSQRVTEIIIGSYGILACHEVLMKRIVLTNGLIEIIVDNLFLDDPQCLCEICRLLTVGLQSSESIKWCEAL